MPPTFRSSQSREARSGANRQYDREREPWRKWYKLKAWSALRHAQLSKEPLCERCLILEDRIEAADTVHHREPHRGDRAKFHDANNLASVCKLCHDGEIQRGERAGWSSAGWSVEGHRIPPRVVQPLGLRPSAIPLTMVCGPPGAGKSTYIDQRRGPDDIVIDIDAILQDLSGEVERTVERRNQYLLDAFIERNRRLASLASETSSIAAWFIIGAPRASVRALWAKQLHPKQIIVIATPAVLCIDRIQAAPLRRPTASGMIAGVQAWWERYDGVEENETLVS